MALSNWFGRRDREPDLAFAAEGYMAVTLLRRGSVEIDLYEFEQNTAAALRRDGCTENQALSVRWGGAYAITADLAAYDRCVKAYEEEVPAPSDPGQNDAHARKKFKSAAHAMITIANVRDPKEYERFLRFIST